MVAPTDTRLVHGLIARSQITRHDTSSRGLAYVVTLVSPEFVMFRETDTSILSTCGPLPYQVPILLTVYTLHISVTEASSHALVGCAIHFEASIR